MAKRNILVLGGTNYFGKHLVSLLLAEGDYICIVTRGNHPVPEACSFIQYDRNSDGKELILKGDWDVIYDQSCYSNSSLKSLKNMIKDCGAYILTSSQAVYPAGLLLNENSIDYEKLNIENYKTKINEYGLEKLKSEMFALALNKNAIFPRFPVVVGVHDPRPKFDIKKYRDNTIRVKMIDIFIHLNTNL